MDTSAPCIVIWGPASPSRSDSSAMPLHGERPVARTTSTPDSVIAATAARTAGGRVPWASRRVPSMSQARRRGRGRRSGAEQTTASMSRLLRRGGAAFPAREPEGANGALRAGPVCGSARRDENGGSGGDLRGQPFGGRDLIPPGAGKASAAGACHHEASAGIAQGRDLLGGAVPTARIAVHLTTSAAASMSDLQGAREPEG